METNATEALTREITAYLSRHPRAADSAEGILRWWLPRIRIEQAVTNVERALDLLVARGVIVAKPMPDGRTVYARVPECNAGSGPEKPSEAPK